MNFKSFFKTITESPDKFDPDRYPHDYPRGSGRTLSWMDSDAMAFVIIDDFLAWTTDSGEMHSDLLGSLKDKFSGKSRRIPLEVKTLGEFSPFLEEFIKQNKSELGRLSLAIAAERAKKKVLNGRIWISPAIPVVSFWNSSRDFNWDNVGRISDLINSFGIDADDCQFEVEDINTLLKWSEVMKYAATNNAPKENKTVDINKKMKEQQHTFPAEIKNKYFDMIGGSKISKYRPAFDPEMGYTSMEGFNNYFNTTVLLEANYSYNIPKDKELIMYDFYMISHWLDSMNFSPGMTYNAYGQEESTTSHRMGLKESTKFSFEHIKKQLIEELRKELLEASLFSISCEFRHYLDRTGNRDIIKQKYSKEEQEFCKYFDYYLIQSRSTKNAMQATGIDKDIIRKEKKRAEKKYNITIHENDIDYAASYEAVKKAIKKVGWDDYQFVKLAKKAFGRNGNKNAEEIEYDKENPIVEDDMLQWSGSYGGRRWYSIANAYLKLYHARSEMEKIIYIDNMYHQQHNTGSVFNKLKKYAKASGHSWLAKALDFKADNKEPYELINKIKGITGGTLRSVDRMYIEMLKAAGKESYNAYFKKEEPKKKEVDDKKDDIAPTGNSFYDKMMEKVGETPDKYPDAYALGYVLVGKGHASGDDLLARINKINPSAQITTIYAWDKYANKMFGGQVGTNPESDYFIKMVDWEKLTRATTANKLEDDKKESSTKIIKTNNSFFNELQQYVPRSKKANRQMFNKGYVYVGKGYDAGKSLLNKINDINSSVIIQNVYSLDAIDNTTVYPQIGSNTEANYFMKKEDWEKLVKAMTKDTKPSVVNKEIYSYDKILSDAKQIEDDCKPVNTIMPVKTFKKLAEYGEKHIKEEILNDKGLGRVVFVGKGSSTGKSLIKQIMSYNPDITMSQIYEKFGLSSKGSFDNDNVIPISVYMNGSDTNSLYFLEKNLWETIFNPLLQNKVFEILTFQEVRDATNEIIKDNPTHKSLEKWIALKEFGENNIDPDLLDGGKLVYLGTGDGNRDLTTQIEDTFNISTDVASLEDNIYLVDSSTQYNSGKPLPPPSNGIFGYGLYFMKKDIWEKIFKSSSLKSNPSKEEKKTGKIENVKNLQTAVFGKLMERVNKGSNDPEYADLYNNADRPMVYLGNGGTIPDLCGKWSLSYDDLRKTIKESPHQVDLARGLGGLLHDLFYLFLDESDKNKIDTAMKKHNLGVGYYKVIPLGRIWSGADPKNGESFSPDETDQWNSNLGTNEGHVYFLPKEIWDVFFNHWAKVSMASVARDKKEYMSTDFVTSDKFKKLPADYLDKLLQNNILIGKIAEKPDITGYDLEFLKDVGDGSFPEQHKAGYVFVGIGSNTNALYIKFENISHHEAILYFISDNEWHRHGAGNAPTVPYFIKQYDWDTIKQFLINKNTTKDTPSKADTNTDSGDKSDSPSYRTPLYKVWRDNIISGCENIKKQYDENDSSRWKKINELAGSITGIKQAGYVFVGSGQDDPSIREFIKKTLGLTRYKGLISVPSFKEMWTMTSTKWEEYIEHQSDNWAGANNAYHFIMPESDWNKFIKALEAKDDKI